MTFQPLADALELEAHLGGAAVLGGQDVGGIGVHVDVGGGEAGIFVVSVTCRSW